MQGVTPGKSGRKVKEPHIDEGVVITLLGSMAAPLTQRKIDQALTALPGWSFRRDALQKTFIFHDFREALAFMVRAGFEAEAMNHHPDWSNSYNRVVVRITTHDKGGKVTAKDVELASRLQSVASKE